jgi:hypothetical protein
MALLGAALAAPDAKAHPDPEVNRTRNGTRFRGPGLDGRHGALGISVQPVDESLADALDLKAGKGALVMDVTPALPYRPRGGANHCLGR